MGSDDWWRHNSPWPGHAPQPPGHAPGEERSSSYTPMPLTGPPPTGPWGGNTGGPGIYGRCRVVGRLRGRGGNRRVRRSSSARCGREFLRNGAEGASAARCAVSARRRDRDRSGARHLSGGGQALAEYAEQHAHCDCGGGVSRSPLARQSVGATAREFSSLPSPSAHRAPRAHWPVHVSAHEHNAARRADAAMDASVPRIVSEPGAARGDCGRRTRDALPAQKLLGHPERVAPVARIHTTASRVITTAA
jgi:hypothetical protein